MIEVSYLHFPSIKNLGSAVTLVFSSFGYGFISSVSPPMPKTGEKKRAQCNKEEY
jgi:hypothetical protein